MSFGLAGLLLCCTAACGGGGGGGGGSVTPAAVSGAPVAVPVGAATAAAGSSIVAAATPASAVIPTAAPTGVAGTPSGVPTIPPTGLTIAGYGGLQGATYAAHTDGATYDYAEDVTIDFNRAIDATSFTANFSVTPYAPWSTYYTNYGKRVQITLRKTPGVTYALALNTGLRSTDGAGLATAATFHISTPASVTIPPRTRAPLNEPYRYGILTHLSGDSLGGTNAARLADLLAQVHAGFVRLDFTGASMMPSPTTTSFTQIDGIVALLAARGVTVLPLLEQYSGAAWQTSGQVYPAIYASPQLYAQFVGTVVAHLAATAPQITRIELFNEPNLTGWWTSPPAAYAATDGSAAATYMLAAYAAAKAANPAITVVGPALSDGGDAVDPRTFLTQMYASGCRTGTCWDVLSVHPYAWLDPTYSVASGAANRWQIYKDLQAVAVAHGDAPTHVMLTEWAYSTANQPVGFDPQVQARYLALGANLALGDPSVDGFVWTSLYATGSDFWSRTALTDSAYAPLPALTAFGAFASP